MICGEQADLACLYNNVSIEYGYENEMTNRAHRRLTCKNIVIYFNVKGPTISIFEKPLKVKNEITKTFEGQK